MPDTQDTKVIIALLQAAKESSEAQNDKIGAEMEHLHDCVHTIDENVKGIKAYFIGIDPQKHIIHHVKMEENEQLSKDIRKAVWGAIVSVIFTGLMAFFSWTTIKAQEDLKEQIAEVIKEQKAAQAAARDRK